MKKNFLFLLILTSISFSQTIDIMTYNIRYDNPKDGENNWHFRKAFLTNQLNYYEPEIFGIQEGLEHQVKYIDSCLSNYEYIGIDRDSNSAGEYSAIFYNKDIYNVVNQNTFWLSPTPAKPSKSWDADLNRICTYGLFEHKCSGQLFWVLNTHLDHRSENAREKSAKLILSKIAEINTKDYPIILMGDFNTELDTKPIQDIRTFLNTSREKSITKPFGPADTFCGFDITIPNKYRIDYIFTSKENIRVNKYAVIANVENSKYPSDHFPVMIEISFLEK